MSTRQYRPNFATLPTTVDQSVREFQREVQQAFRQTFDLINAGQNSLGPASLFQNGSGDKVTIPATTTDPGSGFGLALTLSRPGTWIITAAISVAIQLDSSSTFSLSLIVGSTKQAQAGKLQSGVDGVYTIHQVWQITTSGGDLCRLLIAKDAGSGTSYVDVSNSTMSATWQGQ
ncbi:MAG TPA: hypothetical protein VJQ59_16730 [Candidatus Sulfotelmatobacter sp.]|nr:hypothetical protein [Candidatus Sulfotelmatobacter sp.]